MDLIRVSAQSPECIEEFYVRESAERKRKGDLVTPDLLDFMSECLEHIGKSLDLPPVFGVTSHYRLRLLPGDDYQLPTLVTLQPVVDGPNGCAIEVSYELPNSEAPWRGARISGLATNPIEAAEMVRIALERNAYSKCDR